MILWLSTKTKSYCVWRKVWEQGNGAYSWYWSKYFVTRRMIAILYFFFLKDIRIISQIFMHFFFLNLFIYRCVGSSFLCEGFLQLRQVAATLHRGARASHYRGLSLRSTGSVVVAHGPSCSVACGIFPDQGSNPCPLHWQANSQPLRHQGSPAILYF